MITLDHVDHWFGGFHVLHDLNMLVPEGEIFGFIGPNGAGKTTTIRMMATLLTPSQGQVRVGGLDTTAQANEVRKILGFMPDHFGVYERVTVQEYLEFFASAHEVPFNQRRRTIDAVKELTDLVDLERRLVQTLSKGMRQRLGIARMLLHDPKVLILDEPANGLDPRARIEMRDLILHLRDLGKTILLSSHILSELSDMCTSVAILEKGRIVASGDIAGIAKKLRPEQAVRIRFLPTELDVIATLGALPIASTVERESDGSYHIEYAGDESVLAGLVAACVSAGLGVVRVEPVQNDLERIFLELTRGALQ